MLKSKENNKKIFAYYNEQTIRVYQAYNDKIADQALKIGTFGEHFHIDRMTWIKPSFLWTMYRSGWGTKPDQERVLAIDIKREGFDLLLSHAVLTKYSADLYSSEREWKSLLKNSEVRCQWDPDRDIYGNPLIRRAIQLGIKGAMIIQYRDNWIKNITDITKQVHSWRKDMAEKEFNLSLLPEEREYKESFN